VPQVPSLLHKRRKNHCCRKSWKERRILWGFFGWHLCLRTRRLPIRIIWLWVSAPVRGNQWKIKEGKTTFDELVPGYCKNQEENALLLKLWRSQKVFGWNSKIYTGHWRIRSFKRRCRKAAPSNGPAIKFVDPKSKRKSTS